MGAQITAAQTPTGWRVEVRGGDDVVIETDGNDITVAVHPDGDDVDSTALPLDVTLAS